MSLGARVISTWHEIQGALKKLEASAQRVQASTPRSALGIDHEDVTLQTADGINIRAWYLGAERPRGSVVLHHHFGGQKATTLPWIALLLRQRLSVLALDGRGHAESGTSGAYHAFVRRRLDVLAGIEHLVARNCGPIYVLGQSQGAAITTMAAAKDRRVRGVICDSGPGAEVFTPAWGVIGLLMPEASLAQRAAACVFFSLLGQPVRYSAWLSFSLWRLRNRPLLWLHGNRDSIIPAQRAALWFRAFESRHWRAARVPGARHLMCVERDAPLVETAVQDFLQEAESLPHV